MSEQTYLCFDYGAKRIGVAVGQTLTGTATPLETIKVINGTPDWDKISGLIRQWQPHALVVGLPVSMDDSRQAITDSAEKFTRQLEGRYQLQVFQAEERLTTYEARNRLKKDRGLDPIAAQVILESWLHEKRNTHDKCV